MKDNVKKYNKPSLKLNSLITIQKCCKCMLSGCKSIKIIRRSLDNGALTFVGKPLKVYQYKNITLKFPKEEISLRLYKPNRKVNLPITIYLHGGSWIGGSITTHDNVCRKLCRYSNSIVVSVDYRLAPEFPFPTALIDIYKTILWVYNKSDIIQGDKNRISIVGDSAGGNLAAAVTQYIAKKGGPHIISQVLIYPCTNIYEMNSESWRSWGDDIFLKKDNMERFIAMYVKEKEDRKNPYVSPLFSRSFNNIPPTLIITAEFDPLRDEGLEYFNLLKKAKVDAYHFMVNGVHHGFITMDRVFCESTSTLKKVASFLYKYNK